jgi:hypothetical protein
MIPTIMLVSHPFFGNLHCDPKHQARTMTFLFGSLPAHQTPSLDP